jgi:hypothetical protein
MNYQSFFIPIHESLGKKVWSKEKSEAVVGLEFENETLEEFVMPEIPGWNNHEEHSLRHFGFEYVLRSPRGIDKLKKPVGLYFESMKSALGDLSHMLNSRRTSTHVHFDVGLLNPIEVINISLVYWLIEPLLMEFCGEVRKGNHFCLSAKDTLANINNLRKNIERGNIWDSFTFSNEYRYASLNLASVYKFGSLEYRLMRGLSEEETLWTWINILEAVRKYGLTLKSPRDLYLKFLKKIPAGDFARQVLGSELYSKLRQTLPVFFSEADEVREAFINLSPLMLAHSDWEFAKEIENEKAQQAKYAGKKKGFIVEDDLGWAAPSPFTSSLSEFSLNNLIPPAPAQIGVDEDSVVDYSTDEAPPEIPLELELEDL